MNNIKKYNKAIVVAVATVVATILAIVRGDEPESIPGSIELIIGIATTILVYVIPNISESNDE